VAAPKARQTLSADARPPGVETGWMNRIFAQSHERLEWTGRQVRVGRVGRIPANETSLRNHGGARERVGGNGWPASLPNGVDCGG